MVQTSKTKRGAPRKASADVRDDLLAAAMLVLERDGHDALTVRSVAAQAQVSVVSIYNHYVDKDGLLDAITVRQFERLRDRMRVLEGLGTRIDSRTVVQQAEVEYRDFAHSAPEAYKLMFARSIRDRESLVTVALTAFDAFAVLIAQGQDRGEFTTTRTAAEIARTMWSACHGSALLELNGVTLDKIPSTGASMTDILIDGILA